MNKIEVPQDYNTGSFNHDLILESIGLGSGSKAAQRQLYSSEKKESQAPAEGTLGAVSSRHELQGLNPTSGDLSPTANPRGNELLTITVEIGNGKRENIVIFEHDRAEDVAEEFCERH